MKKPSITDKAMQAILNNVTSYIQLTDDEKFFFLSLLRAKRYSKKEDVLSIGEVCTYQNYVVNGCLKVFYLDEDGNEHIVKFAIENWWSFDIESFFQSTPAYYGISCLEDCEVLQLSKESHELLLSKVPAFEKFYRLLLQNSFIALQYRITQSQSLPAQERYERFQHKYPGLEARISQKNVASY